MLLGPNKIVLPPVAAAAPLLLTEVELLPGGAALPSLPAAAAHRRPPLIPHPAKQAVAGILWQKPPSLYEKKC